MIYTKLLPLAFLPAISGLAIPTFLKRQDENCDAIHLFLARGMGEAEPGRVGDLAGTICPLYTSCGWENVNFDSNLDYCDAIATGATDALNQITAYATRCPSSKLVFGGYSEGGHIGGDLLGGNSPIEMYGSCTESAHPALSPTTFPGTHVAAIVLFGNTRHDAGQSYNVGSGSALDGEYPRDSAELASLNLWADKIQDYCISPDPICAKGDDGESHTTYMTLYAETAAQWVKSVVVE